MKKLTISLFLFSLYLNAFTQIDTKGILKDKLILQNGTVKKVIVIEANDNGVKYKTTTDGEILTISADKIIIVLDENNNKLKFYGCNTSSGSSEGAGGTTTMDKNCQNTASSSTCESSRSGHACFKNTTDRKVYLKADEYMTLLPGECKCDYDISEGDHSYKAYYMSNDQVTGNAFDTGEFYVTKCKTTMVDIRDK
jgi:hypothetical protein